MDISPELKERFCKDHCIPINIFEEPIFSSRIELYDRFYNTVELYNVFLDMIRTRYTTYELESKAKVTTLKKGTAIITVSSNTNPSVKDTCTLKITDSSEDDIITSVSIEPSSLLLAIGDSKTVAAVVLPDTVTNKNVKWSTSDKRIATVKDGKITGISLGSCTITAVSTRDDDMIGTCNIEVTNEIPLESVNFEYHDPQLQVGKQLQLKLVTSPDNCTDTSVLWTSSNTSVATVDNNGLVTAKSAGSCHITAASKENNTIQDVTYLLVENTVMVSKIQLESSSKSMVVGTEGKISYEILPNSATDKSLIWSSSDENVATVDSTSGLIKAVGRGSCLIHAASKLDIYRVADCILNVVPKLGVRDVNLDINDKKIEIENVVELTCNISVGDGIDPSVSWNTSNMNLASIEVENETPTLKSTDIHERDYYNEWNLVKNKLINFIKSSSSYSTFNNVNVDSSWPITCTCLRQSIYTPNMDGHTMISVTVEKPLFAPLNHYSPAIFDNLGSWENFVSTKGETDNEHIIYSENLLYETMKECNQSRIESYSRYILNRFYSDKVKPLITAVGKDENNVALAELVYFDYNELVIDVSKLANVIDLDPSEALLYTNRMIKLYRDIAQKSAGYSCPHSDSPTNQPFPMKTRLFTLYKLKAEYSESTTGKDSEDSESLVNEIVDGYVKNIYYEGNQPLEFVDCDPCQLPILMRSMSHESIQENDRKFYHEGLLAEFTDDYKIYVTPISSIPDSLK